MNEDIRRPRLQPADPWDTRTGVKPIADFEVECLWIPIDEEWAVVKPSIRVREGVFALCKDAEVYRVRREVRGEFVESPELSALAWTERAIGSGGVPVLGMYERSPGHVTGEGGKMLFRWYARVGARRSVAIVKLGGDLEGQVRLVSVN